MSDDRKITPRELLQNVSPATIAALIEGIWNDNNGEQDSDVDAAYNYAMGVTMHTLRPRVEASRNEAEKHLMLPLELLLDVIEPMADHARQIENVDQAVEGDQARDDLTGSDYAEFTEDNIELLKKEFNKG